MSANTAGIEQSGQQGFTSDADNFICSSQGCAGAVLAKVNYVNGGAKVFPGTVVLDATADTLTDASASFRIGTGFTAGSQITFLGFANAANNYPNVFNVTAATATVLTFANQTLASETATGATFIGTSAISMNNYHVGTGLPPNVTVSNFIAGVKTSTLTWCGGATPVNTDKTTLAGQLVQNTGTCQ